MSTSNSNTGLSVREKQAIVKLRQSGVSSHVIANSFGLTTSQVAGIVAHSTMVSRARNQGVLQRAA